ncbi:SGNH/GDSL hydrolase family protein [Vulgatibacter incomptus]|uniref:Putative secreted protein n=1 Tax=Vulgatibacter incomptus TaxID=1391653 RepID=A0A0K1PA81_9BACT|nr:GDSL-type esterase/lipase family protein [Vulgatibacter incomptus]AKU90425.1 putative secreted protein [Vulgatibacter incomptus]
MKPTAFALLLLWGCAAEPQPHTPNDKPLVDPGTDPDPNDPDPNDPGKVTEDPPIFQPGYHQALRWSYAIPSRTTFRIRIPLGRAGDRIRLTFRGGERPAKLHVVTVALADEDGVGALGSEPLNVEFNGSSRVSIAPRALVRSDPLPFRVSFRQELYVSFEAEGELAAGAIDLLPGSFAQPGAHAADPDFDGAPFPRAIGLASVGVEGARTRAFVAIGDSISEAYVSGTDDYRNAWPAVAEDLLGLPVANASVSGQGVLEAQAGLADEVFSLPGITDCLVLIGTNNLWDHDEAGMEAILRTFTAKLAPFCRIWLGTLPPKDPAGMDPRVKTLRKGLNDWIRREPGVAGILDFDALLRRDEDPDGWIDGSREDGVHPSVIGQRLMGEEAARLLGGPPAP